MAASVPGARLRLLNQSKQKLFEGLLDRRLFAAFDQLLAGELADRLQHPVARFVGQGLGGRPFIDQTLVDEARHRLKRIDRLACLHGSDRLCCLQRPAAGENAQSPEQDLLRRSEQVVTPGDGVTQRPLARREVARTSGQGGEPALKPVTQRLGR